MSYDIKCGACGKPNPLGRLYCMGCGTKLEVSEQTVARAKTHERPGRASVPFRLLRLLLSAGLLAALVALLLPVTPTGQVGVLADANILGQKLRNLREAMHTGREISYRISESELNAYLVEMLKKSPPSNSWGLDLRRINVTFQNGSFLVLLEVVRGPFTLTQELRVVPVQRDGRWAFDVTGMRMGRLQLPQQIAAPLAARSAGAFNSLAQERELLERLSALEVKTAWIQVATKNP